MIHLTIDGKNCEAEKGEYILPIARRNGINIPTLCHHDALPGQASCRLCVVEVVERGKKKVVVSCVYPAVDGIEVFTGSEKIRRLRKNILRMLKERAPQNTGLDELCAEYGVTPNERFYTNWEEKCVMCGLCAKACGLLGTSAITTAMRGTYKKVTTPFDEPSLKCIGCGACARNCPTDAIEFIDTEDVRKIWNRTFELVKCTECGKAYATPEEVEYLVKKGIVFPEDVSLCLDCRKKAAVAGI